MKNKRLDHLNQHRKPVSRRELLSLGFIGFAGGLAVPNVLSSVYAQTLKAKLEGDSSFPSFLVFDLSGGAALPGNFLVGHKGGSLDLLKSYSSLGWRPRRDKLDMRFGLPMANRDVSKILDGILSVCSEKAQENFRMGSILHAASSDTSTNPLSAFSLVCKAGSKGSEIQGALGTRASNSGGKSRSPLDTPVYRPVNISRYADLAASVSLAENIEQMPDNTKNVLLKKLSEKAKKFKEKGLLAGLYSEVGDFKPINLDPRIVEEVQNIYNINENTDGSDQEVVFSSITNSVISGYSGPGILTIGGCDYHDGTQDEGDRIDLRIGREIGRAVEMAHRKKKPLFIQILTDGGMYSKDSDVNPRLWQSDSDDKCMTVIGYYDPEKVPQYREKGKTQVGYYTQGQGAERSTTVGSNTTLVAYSVLANYLSVAGKLNKFESVAPRILTKEQLEEVLIF